MRLSLPPEVSCVSNSCGHRHRPPPCQTTITATATATATAILRARTKVQNENTKDDRTPGKYEEELSPLNGTMGFPNWGLISTKGFHGVSCDPEPFWSWEDVIAELNALESQFVNPFISSSKEQKSIELVKIMKDPYCPQSISVGTFAEKSSFETKEAYYQMIGYKRDDGNFESTDSYLQRTEAYLTLYAALIQTEIPGMENTLGLKEGRAWLARFLNVLPAHRTTATALVGFLRAAGYALFRRYGNQFSKILRLISHSFLPKLKAKEDPLASKVINKLESYLLSKQHLSEPEGSRFAQRLESKDFWF